MPSAALSGGWGVNAASQSTQLAGGVVIEAVVACGWRVRRTVAGVGGDEAGERAGRGHHDRATARAGVHRRRGEQHGRTAGGGQAHDLAGTAGGRW
jgi:hypothetical protein